MRKLNGRGRSTARRNADTSLREDLEDLSAQIAKLGNKGWGEGQELIAAEVEKLKAGVDSMVDRALEQGEHSYEQLTDVIQRRPIASLGAAFAAGLVLATMFSRR